MTKDRGFFDWPALLRAGLQVLRLKPSEFWQLTPAELRLMLGQMAEQSPLSRDAMCALLAAYPDDIGGNKDD